MLSHKPGYEMVMRFAIFVTISQPPTFESRIQDFPSPFSHHVFFHHVHVCSKIRASVNKSNLDTFCNSVSQIQHFSRFHPGRQHPATFVSIRHQTLLHHAAVHTLLLVFSSILVLFELLSFGFCRLKVEALLLTIFPACLKGYKILCCLKGRDGE